RSSDLLLVSYTVNYKEVWPSQEYLCKKLNISRTYLQNLLRRAEDLGFICTRFRQWRTNKYKVSSWFFKPQIREQLAKFIPVLWCIFAFNLLHSVNPKEKSSSSPLHTENCAQSSKYIYNSQQLLKLTTAANLFEMTQRCNLKDIPPWYDYGPPEDSE